MRLLHVAPLSGERWVVTLDEDAEPPISEHRTRGEAETSARSYAQTFGYPEVIVHHLNGDVSRMILEVEPQPPYGRTPGPEAG
jgi:hypothetical protein